MDSISRRKFVGAGAVTACAIAPFAAAAAAAPKGRPEIVTKRLEMTTKAPGIPRISYVVARGDTVYTAGVTPYIAGKDDNAPLGDVKDQTRAVLAHIDRLLAEAGTNKSKLLTAQVWLTDMKHFADHCDAWNEWVDPENPPVRACLLSSELWRPGMLVEIMVTASR